jgi:D-3-phosphoglycerate dehydrogenase / 2-oxoglutarate reductase
MSVNNKRVFYVKYLAHQIYAEILNARPDVRLDRLENESAEEIYAPILRDAHAYQVGAARDELASHFHVDENLLRRAPDLLIVSSNGAGFDPVDVDACTKAGVLVVNQSGGTRIRWPNTRSACCLRCRSASSRPTARCAATATSTAMP